ncbi:MAG TPA: hypothetical protein VK672_03985 [Solirubrobacteraceae bacterium]|nr:hypothetical protein [Solirubrobacteraceae bacterium]
MSDSTSNHLRLSDYERNLRGKGAADRRSTIYCGSTIDCLARQ